MGHIPAIFIWQVWIINLLALDRSVGRAVDCSCSVSLVQIRLEGVLVNIFVSNPVMLNQATWL
jgi:hypothetical protein